MLYYAQEASPSSQLLTYLPIILIFAAMYFLLIRPQGKRKREAQEMQAALAPGDDVQTVGGLHGTVSSTDDESVTIEASPGVNLRFTRGAIARVVRQNSQPDTDGDDVTDADVEDSDAAKNTEKG